MDAESIPSAFNNGMSDQEADDLTEILFSIARIKIAISAMPAHRSYSLAITKLEEASHWMNDRKHKPAGRPLQP